MKRGGKEMKRFKGPRVGHNISLDPGDSGSGLFFFFLGSMRIVHSILRAR